MDTGDLRDALEEAGLSQYQADAYTALLQFNSASATELADACSVPNARIYDVLRDLEEEGYVATYEGETLQVRAEDPETVLSDLRRRAERFTAAAEEIETRWEEPAVDSGRVSIVSRFDTVFERARAAVREADNEVQLSADTDALRRLLPDLAAAREDGALVKVSVHTEAGAEPDLPPETDLAGAVTEVRHRDLPAQFLAVADRTVTCFAPHRNSVNEYGVLIDDYSLTYVFHWYFQTCLWEAWSTAFGARDGEPPLEYTDVRRFVRDVEPLVDAGDRVRVAVEGFDPDTGETRSFEGVVDGVEYAGDALGSGELPLSQLAGKVSVRVEADDGTTRTVGGWGAVIEDVEARRLTVLGRQDAVA